MLTSACQAYISSFIEIWINNMTLEKLLNELKHLDLTLPLIFSYEGGEIGAGYHVTEIKSAHIKSIDCGRRISEWDEMLIQLLDGQKGQHMIASKFVSIVEHSSKVLGSLETKPVYFEFALKNLGLELFSLERIEVIEDRILARLTPNRAMCKPASLFIGDNFTVDDTNSSCCGKSSSMSVCCA